MEAKLGPSHILTLRTSKSSVGSASTGDDQNQIGGAALFESLGLEFDFFEMLPPARWFVARKLRDLATARAASCLN